MGVDRALTAASAIKHERLRFISRDERIARFGIDRREFHESRWMLTKDHPFLLSVVKSVTEAKGAESSNIARYDSG